MGMEEQWVDFQNYTKPVSSRHRHHSRVYIYKVLCTDDDENDFTVRPDYFFARRETDLSEDQPNHLILIHNSHIPQHNTDKMYK